MVTLANGQVIRFGEDYETKFDTAQYLQRYEDFGPIFQHFPLQELHKLCVELKAQPATLTVLDIGTGPCVVHSISIAPYASQIVFAEYAAVNRAMLTSWLENQRDAYDWTPYFMHVVIELEGKDEMEVAKREAMVREKVRAVVPCDITKDPPIPQEYIEKYDIVQSFLCLESACATKEDFSAAIVRMASLLKPGGKMVLYFGEPEEVVRKSYYHVGSEIFFNLDITKAFVVDSIEHAGLCDVKLATLSQDQMVNGPRPIYRTFHFLTATKEENTI